METSKIIMYFLTHMLPGLLALIAVLCIYFLPSIIANKKKHRNLNAIQTLNLLLGWTIIGWIISLVWAQTNSE